MKTEAQTSKEGAKVQLRDEKPLVICRGRGMFRGRGRSRGRGRGFAQRQVPGEYKAQRNYIQCHNCKKYGHVKADCWFRDQSANVAEEQSTSTLFMAKHETDDVASSVWLVDSGCSNHMTGQKNLLRELDETQKQIVKLGDNKDINVEGKGIVSLKTSYGKVKLLHDVQFVPNLAHNLLSVGQLLENGYSVLFDGLTCSIKDRNTGRDIISTHKTKNNMFSLEITNLESLNLTVKNQQNSKLWHLRYGHLNAESLRLLSQKNLVHGISRIHQCKVCEGCAYGKQTMKSFPTENS